MKNTSRHKLSRRITLLLIGLLASSACALDPMRNNVNEIQKTASKNIGGLLYPRATETRDVRTLNGIWNFRTSPPDPLYGYVNGWHQQDLSKTGPVIPMPVPSSYNDVGVDASLRDHLGVVWYDRRFFVPRAWADNQRVWLRFSSVHYYATVYLNGKEVTSHEIGHLPFEVEITDNVSFNSSNLLTVAIDNRLAENTIPQDDLFVDFFNYAGIHRTVYIYSTPRVYIEDIAIQTDVKGDTGLVSYNIMHKASRRHDECMVEIFDKNGSKVGSLQVCSGVVDIAQANLWWPYRMHSDPGYLYTFKASLIDSDGELLDTYSVTIGIRVVNWTTKSVYLNGKPLYLRGFGMHEDSDFRGKGWDPVLWVKNFNLIKWTGANAFRTSHYPYAEEIYQLADEQGIMIIGESPSCLSLYTEELLQKHKQALTEMIQRDRNRPSVIMWSIANEPQQCGSQENCDGYFSEIVRHVKDLDLSRPVTFSLHDPEDEMGKFIDVISFNRYMGWYIDTGSLVHIAQEVVNEGTHWHLKYNKPILMSEYGADTIAGMHNKPEFVFSEEYQVALMSEHFKAFDKLRHAGFFIGEFIWNFADFATRQATIRVGGNKKGIFTRARQPKAGAHHLRARYLALAAADAGAPPPPPEYYVADNEPAYHEEL